MKIDVSEVRVQKELLVISVNSIKEQLSVSRSRLSEVVSTDSLKGAVKDAINQKVTNYQIPLVDNYVNALDSIVSRYDGLVKLFQDTVSETDNSAIIKTEYLERIKQRMKDPIEGLKSSSSKTQNIYAGISDILTLTNPSLDSVNTSYNQAVKSLDDTIKNMEAFNSVLLKTDTFDLIDMQNSEIATLSGYAPLPYGNRVSRNYYNRTQFKNSVSEIHTAIHSNSKAVKYQNALAKQLAESKYSGTVISEQQKEISVSKISETFGLTPPEAEDVADYIKSMGEAIVTYRGANIFLNGIKITMDSQGRMRWGNRFLFKSNSEHLYRHGINFQDASGIDFKNYHYSGNLKGIARFSEMGKAGWSGFKESVNPLNDAKGWREVGKFGKTFKLAGGILTAINIYNNFRENVDMSDGISAKEARDFTIDTAVDIGSGAAAAGMGAAIGSAFLPPLGTVVGAVAGIGFNYLFNSVKSRETGKSLVDTIKDFGKNVGDDIGKRIGDLLSSKFGG
ncbi:T7SS effector LXG polymorphic toxin [Streptococcus oralis]|uniref:T7SS effector LXG polymorphic toxin n=1 Tax=Streptococcus oralis TaxID=1303 RepID=UPI001EFD6BCC|nr:T7SS effector LXG polymorphic toxin [Streptococcus oralis]DAY28319.1 MAG TPA: LXG domain of WXG superfamily [Caudoviricetes sp.]